MGWCLFSKMSQYILKCESVFYSGEGPSSRHILRDCISSNFAKICIQLYCWPSVSMVLNMATIHCLKEEGRSSYSLPWQTFFSEVWNSSMVTAPSYLHINIIIVHSSSLQNIYNIYGELSMVHISGSHLVEVGNLRNLVPQVAHYHGVTSEAESAWDTLLSTEYGDGCINMGQRKNNSRELF